MALSEVCIVGVNNKDCTQLNMQHCLIFLYRFFHLYLVLLCRRERRAPFPVTAPWGMKSSVNTDDNPTLLDLWPLPHQAARRGQRSIRLPEARGTFGKVGGSRVFRWEGAPRGVLLPSPSEVSGKVVPNWCLCPGLPAVASSLRLCFDCTQVWSGRNLTVWLNIKILPTVSTGKK